MKFRKSKPFTISVADEYDLDLDYNPTEELIFEGGFSIHAPKVTNRNAYRVLITTPSISPAIIGDHILYLVNFGVEMSSGQAITELQKRGLICANLGHLLIFGIRHPRVSRSCIAALGTLRRWVGKNPYHGAYYLYISTRGKREISGKGYTNQNAAYGQAADLSGSPEKIMWSADTCFLVIEPEEDNIFPEED